MVLMVEEAGARSRHPFLKRLAEGVVLADGAMGTVLYDKGIPFDRSFDVLNLTDPALVQAVHREYIRAGAELIETNTFGANRYRLAAHGVTDPPRAVNRAGAAAELQKRGSTGRTNDQQVADGRVRMSQRACVHLDHGVAAQRSGHPPRWNRLPNPPHDSVAADERHVDRELHEEGMDGVRGGDNHRTTFRQFSMLQEAPAARCGVERADQTICQDDAGATVDECAVLRRLTQQRVQKRRHRSASRAGEF